MAREPLKGSDYLFDEDAALWWARGPIEDWAKDLTYDEVHAMELGLVGVLAGAGWWLGFHTYALGVSGVLVALAFGLKRIPAADGPPLEQADGVLRQLVKSVAGKVVRREPWYFTTVYLVTATVTAGVLEVLL